MQIQILAQRPQDEPLIEPLLGPGGIMVSSDRMYFAGLRELPLPPDAVEGRCFVYRRDA